MAPNDGKELLADYPHELEPGGSLRKCRHCGRWFHNEADAGEEFETCDVRLRVDES